MTLPSPRLALIVPLANVATAVPGWVVALRDGIAAAQRVVPGLTVQVYPVDDGSSDGTYPALLTASVGARLPIKPRRLPAPLGSLAVARAVGSWVLGDTSFRPTHGVALSLDPAVDPVVVLPPLAVAVLEAPGLVVGAVGPGSSVGRAADRLGLDVDPCLLRAWGGGVPALVRVLGDARLHGAADGAALGAWPVPLRMLLAAKALRVPVTVVHAATAHVRVPRAARAAARVLVDTDGLAGAVMPELATSDQLSIFDGADPAAALEAVPAAAPTRSVARR